MHLFDALTTFMDANKEESKLVAKGKQATRIRSLQAKVIETIHTEKIIKMTKQTAMMRSPSILLPDRNRHLGGLVLAIFIRSTVLFQPSRIFQIDRHLDGEGFVGSIQQEAKFLHL